MQEKVKKFLSMLIVELDDLEDNIAALMKTSEERFNRHEITGYVWTENRALLQREINLLEMIKKEVRRLEPSEFSGIDSAREGVRRCLEEFVDIPAAIPDLIEKRMEKIQHYLRESER